MAHLQMFKEFDTLTKVGDFFLLPLKPYKDFNSARGTVTSAATDYRRARNTNFYVSTHHEGRFLKVERVRKATDKLVFDNDRFGFPTETRRASSSESQPIPPSKGTTITMKKLESLTKQFPHDSTIFISELKTYLKESMKPFNDFVKL